MLVLNDVFQKTWADFPISTSSPATEFWADAIPVIKAAHPDFLLLAEVYWGMDKRLLELGFDFTYDKQIYDCLLDHRYAELQRHLLESPAECIARGAHFLENHDEPRIATLLSPAEHRASAMLILGLPGMRFLYDGQLTGARVHVPVQLNRCLKEPVDRDVQALYEQIMSALKNSAVGTGQPTILGPAAAWDGNPTAQNFVIVQWLKSPAEFNLVVINLASHQGQCRVRLAVEGLSEKSWEMRDSLGGEMFQREGAVMERDGLFLDLPGHGAQLLLCRPAGH
jgi:hypothetical protein